ncbi:hypothetical protein GQ43DRAFT_398024 [Delitschia confertaspora ATCC 74209]|uniref:Zn(2)-C6 fungal-type domain-containing protein n=1 Tax=Delitschia confertaspora ATCC 74209 TaxID=1513339 RepID=A0A9P4JMY2_9PLEO|nr:hypothetical protein GQ43DRAFT_398024 [Delitschia confertaspora ATCC 74209]
MNVSNLLASDHVSGPLCPEGIAETATTGRQYNTRQAAPTYNGTVNGEDHTVSGVYPSTETSEWQGALSPTKTSEPKHVSFELLLQQPHHRARLPMRVNIYPHDTTDSIITTVKNFYGLYERKGVVFEDRHGAILIARYENFAHNMVVYVKVIEDPETEEYSSLPSEAMSPRRRRVDDPFQMPPPALNRPDLQPTRQSNSPQPGRGRRSASASTHKSRAKPLAKSRGTSSHGSFADPHGDLYSDSDGGSASVTSSRRGRKEQVASADISLDNIVEGGRRKRAKFDSSELPLFVPPQVPMTASLSSVSPQRRISSHNGASPFSQTNQQTFAYSHALQTPQNFGQFDNSYAQGLPTPYSTSSGQAYDQQSRTRGSVQYNPYRQAGNGGLALPTPDPTVGSVISDEDVARQLMRLGDASNISCHGRTSTSTLDDALSGKAEAASSSDNSDDGSDIDEHELPPLPYSLGRLSNEATRDFEGGSSGDEYEDNKDGSFKNESDETAPDGHHGSHAHTNGARARSSVVSKAAKPNKSRVPSKSKAKNGGNIKVPMSPASLPQSRKASSVSLGLLPQLPVDEEDLSTKPRCQRCRKSKKGCDRQRPCQRCKDAGIGIDGCISEEEGNGRKGRYGRHMGVPVKKTAGDVPCIPDHGAPAGANIPAAASNGSVDKSRKRKR